MGDNALIVVAIDFGTTYSGYAYSMRHDYELDNLKIQIPVWNSGSGGIALTSYKTPSTLLLSPDKRLDSFGYEAENKYIELSEENDHHGWLYFKQFKMLLHNNRSLKRTAMISDINNQLMPAKIIFSLAIRYLRGEVTKMLDKQLSGWDEDIVRWVLTVPAIWDEGAKQFMREAAIDAGIDDRFLKLAYEPEAASLYCKKQPMSKAETDGTKSSRGELDIGTKYIVLDLGGGTMDMTVHEILCGGSIRELQSASGGAYGGTTVDKLFTEFLSKLIGIDTLRELQNQSMEDYLDIYRELEIKKRTIKPKSDGKISMRIPATMLEIYGDIHHKKLAQVLPDTEYSDTVTIRGDKMMIKAEIWKGFFKTAVEGIIDHLLNFLYESTEGDVSTILLVGGFAESPMIEHNLREMLPDKIIITPPDAGAAVLKGAVLYGHAPEIIKSRKAKYTYGVEVNQIYVPGIHPNEFKFCSQVDRKMYCSKCFDRFVNVDQDIEVGSIVSRVYNPTEKDAIEGIGIYRSKKTPDYVSDPSCHRLGCIKIRRPNGGWPPHFVIQVDMMFGGTEINVTVYDDCLGESYRDSFDLLQ